eukprot:5003400-Prymnesium_polylepis.1
MERSHGEGTDGGGQPQRQAAVVLHTTTRREVECAEPKCSELHHWQVVPVDHAQRGKGWTSLSELWQVVDQWPRWATPKATRKMVPQVQRLQPWCEGTQLINQHAAT